MKEEPAINDARFVGGDAVAHEVDGGSWVVVGSLNDEAEMDLRESVVRFNFQNLPKDSNSNRDQAKIRERGNRDATFLNADLASSMLLAIRFVTP